MPKLLYLVTEDWFFVSHFLPMARTAKAAGFEVVVATRVRDHAARIAAEGCRVVSLENERRSFGPFEALRGFFRMMRIVREERPDIVHCIALRMVVLGGLAARFGGAQRLVLAPTGLGHVWSNHGPVERIARALARAHRRALAERSGHALFVREHRRSARIRPRSGASRRSRSCPAPASIRTNFRHRRSLRRRR